MRIHKVAAATLMSVLAAGSLIAASSAPALASHASSRVNPATLKFATVTVSPSKNLVAGQKITVKASKFPKATTTLYAVECSAQITSLDETYCDTTAAHEVQATPTDGAATFKFTVYTTGHGFAATHAGSNCSHGKICYIVVADGATLATTTTVGFPLPALTFKDLRPTTKTTVKSHKSVKIKKLLTLTARTTHAKGTAALSGTVTFKDGKKKLKKVKESASGKVTVKIKLKKKGKQHITATYSGSKNYQPSTGKKLVVVKI